MTKAQSYFDGTLTTRTKRWQQLPHKVSFGNTKMAKTKNGAYRSDDGHKFITTTTLREDLFALISDFAKRQEGKVTLLVEGFTLRVFILAGIVPMGCEKALVNERYGLAMIFQDIQLSNGESTITFDVKIHRHRPALMEKAEFVAKTEGYAFFDVKKAHICSLS